MLASFRVILPAFVDDEAGHPSGEAGVGTGREIVGLVDLHAGEEFRGIQRHRDGIGDSRGFGDAVAFHLDGHLPVLEIVHVHETFVLPLVCTVNQAESEVVAGVERFAQQGFDGVDSSHICLFFSSC